jgi:glyoxylase-like metal-dependent hydrolase (beta-lactamase superfamily II)
MPSVVSRIRSNDMDNVGSQDLASYLVTTPKGNILISANLPSSPPQIRASVEKLGFQWADVRILLTSQAHFDHMGGAAEVIRETHAQNMVMDGNVGVVETGARKDFLWPSPNVPIYSSVRVNRVLHDGDTADLGGVTLTAHKTAGHTRGCTTWTMRSHIPGDPAGILRNVVIIGGTGFWSEYHFVATPGHPASYRGIAGNFQRTFCRLIQATWRRISRRPSRLLRYAQKTDALPTRWISCVYRLLRAIRLSSWHFNAISKPNSINKRRRLCTERSG